MDCLLPDAGPSKKPSKTRPWLWPATGQHGARKARGLRARCQASEGTRGRSIIRTYGLMLAPQQVPWFTQAAVSCVPQVRRKWCAILIVSWAGSSL